uniref:Uncharacterized protein n=1 Tax=Arundo donax TaxID=35708 RepID=A0A0A9AFA6_ARUDO
MDIRFVLEFQVYVPFLSFSYAATVAFMSMAAWPELATVRELQALKGCWGYYRRFVPGYGAISNPLTQLLKKWVEKQLLCR